MSRVKAKPKRIDIKDGNVVIPIYEFSDGRFCVDTMLGEKRKRITRASFDAAKRERRRQHRGPSANEYRRSWQSS